MCKNTDGSLYASLKKEVREEQERKFDLRGVVAVFVQASLVTFLERSFCASIN